jgi:HK97 family phage portal protein
VPALQGSCNPRTLRDVLEGLVDGWRRLFASPPSVPSESDLGGQIQWAVDRRLGRGDYLALPAVGRARQLIISTIAQLEPVAYRDGVAMADQPAIVTRPSPGLTRYEWLAQIASSLVDAGDAILWLPKTGRNAEGWPDLAVVIPPNDVHVEWAQEPITRKYQWRDRELVEGTDVLHIALDRGPGELRGHSVFDRYADALNRIMGTELYAADWFDTGAVPDTVLRFSGSMTDAEAETVKNRWIANHSNRAPAVLPAGWDLTATGSNPQDSQLLESRGRGDVEVARMFGIVPAELLLVAISGSSLTYQNVSGMLDTLIRVTVQPTYLSAIEEGLSDLLPRTQVVRFSFDELYRLREPEAINTYAAALAAGIYDLAEVRARLGQPASSNPQTPPALRPTRTVAAEAIG